ncbi:MAG: HesA/MoeB/ThiF family protein [Desulfobacterales bacterium]|mgnify:FL=1|jgi:molybdopterin/thiamine biosynthesis adenylyltransferase|nr:HesA/MoeB/ThiF family protein [Desulfobacterales bacterium]
MPNTILDFERLAEARVFPDKTPYKSLSVHHILDISRRSGAPGREIEIAALENGIVPERYARNMRTFSLADQAALLKAHAAVVGLGGLGGAVTEILARMGVGRLTLVDGDRFEDSNLNRQLLSSIAHLGHLKAEAARQRVDQINPSVGCRGSAEFLTPENAPELLAPCDVVVDCLDNLPARFMVEDACRQAGRPMVSAAVAGTSGHVTTIFPEDRGLRLIYGEPQHLPLKGAETALGTVPFSVIFLASLECAEVAKIILKKGSPFRNKLLVADLTDGVIEVMNLA